MIVGIAARAEGAVLVWSDVEESRGWTSLVDKDGRELWSADLPGAPMADGGTGPAVIAGDVAVIRYRHGNDSAAVGLGLVDGRVLWDKTLAGYTAKNATLRPRLPNPVSGLAGGNEYVAIVDTGTAKDVAIGLDARSGVPHWRVEVPEHPQEVLVDESTLAVLDGRYATLIDIASHQSKRVEVPATGCMMVGAYVAPIIDNPIEHTFALLQLRIDEDPIRTGLDPRLVKANESPLSCRLRRDEIVWFLGSHLAVAGRYDMTFRRIDLGDEPELPSPGELPRFVVLAIEGTTRRLVVVDLDTGTTKRSAPIAARHVEVIRAGTRWLVVADDRLYGFDGTTGTLIGAVELPRGGLRDVRRTHPGLVSGDTLWVFEDARGADSEGAFGAIDLATMKPRFSRELDIRAAGTAGARLGL